MELLSDGEETLETAKANLERFNLVGTLDDVQTFARRFEDLFGCPLRNGRRNESPVSVTLQRELVTPEIYSRVEELCEPDILVYQRALVL